MLPWVLFAVTLAVLIAVLAQIVKAAVSFWNR
jgi:hypothetical protein